MNASARPSSWVLSSLSKSVGPWLPGQKCHWQNLCPHGVCRHFWERGEKPSLLSDYSVALTQGVNLAGRCQDLPSLQAPLQMARDNRGTWETQFRSHSLHVSWFCFLWGFLFGWVFFGGGWGGWPCRAPCRISIPRPGIEPGPLY